MDTNTVNFALSKITGAIEKIAPSVVNVSEKYVSFMVAKACIPFIISFLLAACSTIILKILYKKGNIEADEPNIEGISAVVLFIILAVSLIACFVCCADVILAISNPEMYAIHELINASKAK